MTSWVAFTSYPLRMPLALSCWTGSHETWMSKAVSAVALMLDGPTVGSERKSEVRTGQTGYTVLACHDVRWLLSVLNVWEKGGIFFVLFDNILHLLYGPWWDLGAGRRRHSLTFLCRMNHSDLAEGTFSSAVVSFDLHLEGRVGHQALIVINIARRIHVRDPHHHPLWSAVFLPKGQDIAKVVPVLVLSGHGLRNPEQKSHENFYRDEWEQPQGFDGY